MTGSCHGVFACWSYFFGSRSFNSLNFDLHKSACDSLYVSAIVMTGMYRMVPLSLRTANVPSSRRKYIFSFTVESFKRCMLIKLNSNDRTVGYSIASNYTIVFCVS